MAQSSRVADPGESRTDTDAIRFTKEYYFAILEGSDVYHIAHDGETVCSMSLGEQTSRWFKRGSENVIPPEMRLCHFCESGYHRELALSKAHIREELASLAGTERTESGSFSKQELAELLAAFREQETLGTVPRERR